MSGLRIISANHARTEDEFCSWLRELPLALDIFFGSLWCPPGKLYGTHLAFIYRIFFFVLEKKKKCLMPNEGLRDQLNPTLSTRKRWP